MVPKVIKDGVEMFSYLIPGALLIKGRNSSLERDFSDKESLELGLITEAGRDILAGTFYKLLNNTELFLLSYTGLSLFFWYVQYSNLNVLEDLKEIEYKPSILEPRELKFKAP